MSSGIKYLESNNIYEADCIQIVWKDEYAILISIQDITKSIQLQDTISDIYSNLIRQVRSNIGIDFIRFALRI